MEWNSVLAHIIEWRFHGDQLQKDVMEAGLRPQGRAAWQSRAFQHGRPYYCFIYRGYTRCCPRNFHGAFSSLLDCKWPLSGLCGSWCIPDPLKDVSFPVAAPVQNASHFCRLLLRDDKQQWIWSSECVSGKFCAWFWDSSAPLALL